MKHKWIIPSAICIGFVLIHSVISESKSAYESLWFTEKVLTPVLIKFGMAANKDMVKKIAHAVEFCALALILSALWKKQIKVFYAGFTLAFLDESLQILTGRGALITDIWIDLIGVVLGILIGWLTMPQSKKQETR